MKNSIKLFALAALLGLGGCHEPDELTPSVVDQGLNTISAQFATGEYKNDPLFLSAWCGDGTVER